jgi:hypothetical protein
MLSQNESRLGIGAARKGWKGKRATFLRYIYNGKRMLHSTVAIIAKVLLKAVLEQCPLHDIAGLARITEILFEAVLEQCQVSDFIDFIGRRVNPFTARTCTGGEDYILARGA